MLLLWWGVQGFDELARYFCRHFLQHRLHLGGNVWMPGGKRLMQLVDQSGGNLVSGPRPPRRGTFGSMEKSDHATIWRNVSPRFQQKRTTDNPTGWQRFSKIVV
jgi:hypothetical protein